MKLVDERNSCGCDSGCCGGQQPSRTSRQIVIDFLYLDLTTCTRCQGTDENLEEALQDVSRFLQATGAEVLLNRINVNTAELALEHKFVSSPTIRVNGRDIQLEVTENSCESCGDLCGTEVDCRTWIYQGVEYEVPPKAMIIDGIMRVIYGGQSLPVENTDYVMPENLKRFYSGSEQSASGSPCCTPRNARRVRF